MSDEFKEYCNSMNFTQLIDSPIRPNAKCPEKSTLIDLFITNNPHKYTSAGVFPNDVSDHRVIACVRDAKFQRLSLGILPSVMQNTSVNRVFGRIYISLTGAGLP